MWKLLILLFSVAAHASAQSTVPLVAYKKRESGTEVYQYTVGSNGPAPRDFTIVNGENKEDGDFTYIKVFAYAPYEGNYESFNKQYDICIARFSNGLTTHLLSSSGCREALVPEQVPVFSVRQGTTFFASDQKPRRQGVEVFLNQCRDNRNTFTFTKLTTGEASCPSGTNKDFTESFWAYSSGGLACPPKEETIRDGYTTNSDGDVFPNRLTLNCNSGFEVKGTKSVNCEGGRWSGELGGCSRVSCGKPKSPENGNIEGRNYFYEGSILYTCNEGYKLDRPYSQRRDCTSNRQWNPSEEPNCERKSCGSPGDLIYGSMQSNGELFGDIARYRCDEGYKLIGSRQRECKSDGTWTGSKPSCERITCKPLAQPRNGQHDGNAPSKFASGSVVLFKCHEGYKMDGAEILRCQLDSVSESASWSNEAPLCQPIVCKSPAGTSNVDIEGTDFTFGKSIRFRCRDGYNLQGSSIATCNANGWDTEVPSCSAKECNNPGTPDNGKRQGDNFNVYSTVTFSCNNGYRLTPPDSETIICLPTTRWNRPSPICEPIQSCDLPTACNSNPCENGASCFSSPSRFYCLCPPGFSGQTCASQVCKPNPCQNGGQCIAFGSFALCSCSGRHVGRNCEISV